MKKIQTLPLLATVGLWLLSLDCSKAANYTVEMGPSSLTFNPPSIAVNQGDTVTWTNGSPFVSHTSTSGAPAGTPNGLWNTGTLGGLGVGSMTFNNFATNTYPYYCSFHTVQGMIGSLTVTNAVPEPQPTLTSATLAAGQFHFTIQGLIGQKYAVQSSPDFTAWTSINTNLATSTSSSATDPSASNAPAEYYRVLEIQ